MGKFHDWVFNSGFIKHKPTKSCEECFYYHYEESHPEYFKFCGKCLESKNKPMYHKKGGSQ